MDERVRLLKAVCDNLAKDKDGLARLITTEMGKVFSEAKEEAEFAADKHAVIDKIREANLPEKYGTGNRVPL